jgi:CBS domain-containing protein
VRCYPDRAIKALALKKTDKFIEKGGYISVSENITTDRLLAEFEQAGLAVAYLIDDEGRLIGRSCREGAGTSARIIHGKEPVSIDKKSNLNETLSRMLETGEKMLPVVDRRKNLLGVVKLSHIFREISSD